MPALQYDGLITIATGSSRRSASWKTKEMLWSEFVDKLGRVTRTQETQQEYFRMPKEERDNAKDVGGFVGGTLKGGRRKIDAVLQRRLITLDMDSITAGEDPWPTVVLILGCAAVLYSTHSHTAKAPRLRLVLPLSRPVSPEEYEAIARRIAGDIGIDMCDDTTYEPHRLMYWASASSDGEFRYEVQDGPWLDADEQLARYADWKDPTQWPVSSRKSGTIRRLADKQGDPTAKDGIVGAFCRTYSVEDAIEAFLPEVYIKGENGRYTYKGGSTSGGLVIYEDGRFAYSHHSTDPTCGKLCNAFDLVRIHMFGKDDEGKPANTAANNLPSYKNMCKWIETNCESVMKELQSKQLDYIVQLFGEGDEAPDMNWVSQLEVNPKTGHAATTVENIRIKVLHDCKLEALDQLIEEANGQPVLVFYAFRHERDRIMERYPEAVDIKDDGAVVRWNEGKIPIMLAHPASAGHGLNLQAGGHIAIWYGLPTSLELYQQANKRLHRPGQKKTVLIHHILMKDTYDYRVLDDILAPKEVRQNACLEALKARIKEVSK